MKNTLLLSLLLLSACSETTSGGREQAARGGAPAKLKTGLAFIAADGTNMHEAAQPKIATSQDAAQYLQRGGVLHALLKAYEWSASAYIAGPTIDPFNLQNGPLKKIDVVQSKICEIAVNPAVAEIVLGGYSRGVAIALTALWNIYNKGGCGKDKYGQPIYPKVSQFLFIDHVPVCLLPGNRSSSSRASATAGSASQSIVELLNQFATDAACADLKIPADGFVDGVATVDRHRVAWGLDWLAGRAENGSFQCLHLSRSNLPSSYGPVQRPTDLPVQRVSLAGKCVEETVQPSMPHDLLGFSKTVQDQMMQTINERFAVRAGEPTEIARDPGSFQQSCPQGSDVAEPAVSGCTNYRTTDVQKFNLNFFPVYSRFPVSGVRPENIGASRFFRVDIKSWCQVQSGAQVFALFSRHPEQVSTSFKAGDQFWIDSKHLECAD